MAAELSPDIAAELKAARCFWENNRGHPGEPANWSDADLQEWLNDAAWLDAPRDELLKEVTRRLDDLYRTASPTYPNVTTNINLTSLLQWEPLTKPVDAIKTGPLERSFTSSFSLQEQLARVGGRSARGRHPLDDLRMQQLHIAKVHDEGQYKVTIMQDIDQDEPMALTVLGVRFLPPGRKLRAGDRVVCHNLHGEGERLQHLGGLTASVVSCKKSAGTSTLALDPAGDDAPAGAVCNVVRRALRVYAMLVGATSVCVISRHTPSCSCCSATATACEVPLIAAA
jgi:hypothetical protein